MKNMIKVAGVLTLSVLPVLLGAPAAFAAGYDNIASQLKGDNSVYVETGMDVKQIQNGFDGTNISVVVYDPQSLDGTFTPSQIAEEIRSLTEDKTTIVIVDNANGDRIAVSSEANQTEISEIIQKSLTENNGDAGEAVASTVADVKSLSEGSAVSSGGSSDAVAGLGFIIPFALALIGGVGLTIFFARKFNKNKQNSVTGNNTGRSSAAIAPVPTKFNNLVPDSLVPLMKQLSDVMRVHNTLPHGSLATEVRNITDNLQELFKRLKKKGTNSQQKMAEVEYADKLPKLIEALGENYYVDIINHDNLWDDADARLENVAVAVKAVKQQLVENIRQVNASKDLEFQVALGSLIGSTGATNIETIYKNKNL